MTNEKKNRKKKYPVTINEIREKKNNKKKKNTIRHD